MLPSLQKNDEVNKSINVYIKKINLITSKDDKKIATRLLNELKSEISILEKAHIEIKAGAVNPVIFDDHRQNILDIRKKLAKIFKEHKIPF